MSEQFLRFKQKYNRSRLLKSVLYGGAAGIFCAGLFLVLAKCNVFRVNLLFALPIGLGVAALAWLFVYLLLRRNDLALARILDRRFVLAERVETMLAYKQEEGTILDLQRRDTDEALSKVPTAAFSPKRLWIAFLALGVSAVLLLSGFILPNQQNKKPPVQVVPFSLSELQRVGMNGLIEDVRTSDMEEPYRSQIEAELTELLQTLENTDTQAAMKLAVGGSMNYIWQVTSDSSSMTEIAEALWGTQDDYAKALAKAIDTSKWQSPDWGDYAEKYTAFRALYDHIPQEGETPPDENALYTELKWKLESSALKMSNALSNASVSETDSLYLGIDNLLHANYDDDTGMVLGFAPLAVETANLTYAQTVAAVDKLFGVMTGDIYDAISVQKKNTNVGEYAMTKLSDFFPVPVPVFERPNLVDKQNGGNQEEGDEENNGNNQGGIGGGASYGSDDYVLDPLTGEYVKYGTLLERYNALMMEKLEGETYTEAQKENIRKYFELLYSGIKKKDEGK